MTHFPEHQIRELAQDPNLEAIYAGTIISDLPLYVVYDTSFKLSSLAMEPGDDVLVSKHKDGTYFIHAMGHSPNSYHYKAPWLSDDQVTHDEGAIYHV